MGVSLPRDPQARGELTILIRLASDQLPDEGSLQSKFILNESFSPFAGQFKPDNQAKQVSSGYALKTPSPSIKDLEQLLRSKAKEVIPLVLFWNIAVHDHYEDACVAVVGGFCHECCRVNVDVHWRRSVNRFIFVGSQSCVERRLEAVVEKTSTPPTPIL